MILVMILSYLPAMRITSYETPTTTGSSSIFDAARSISAMPSGTPKTSLKITGDIGKIEYISMLIISTRNMKLVPQRG